MTTKRSKIMLLTGLIALSFVLETNSLRAKSTEEPCTLNVSNPKLGSEAQILIETNVVEVLTSDLNGADWAKMLQPSLNVNAGKAINWDSIILGAGADTVGQVTMSVQDAETIIHALQKSGKGTITNMPKTRVPVVLYSTVSKLRPAYQIPTSNVKSNGVYTLSGFNTFTTGTSLNLAATLIDKGIADINVTISVAKEIGEQEITATSYSPTQRVPIISNRTITTSANVPLGMTVMIGGLTEVVNNKSEASTPLSKLLLFTKTWFGKKDQTTTIVFLTPTLIYPNKNLTPLFPITNHIGLNNSRLFTEGNYKESKTARNLTN